MGFLNFRHCRTIGCLLWIMSAFLAGCSARQSSSQEVQKASTQTSAGPLVDDFSGVIRQLADDAREEDAIRALKVLSDAGIRVFPSLIAHFDDEQLIHPRLNAFEVLGDLTVGWLCFVILQDQIEGNWPKGFRQFYILTPDNAKQWLDKHKGLSLRELQVISREESLRRAELALAASPGDFMSSAVKFLRQQVEGLKK